MKQRFQKYIDDDPELAEGYNKIFRVWIIYGSIPWLIMAIGMLTGTTHNVFEYFNPKALNPAVLAFHFSLVLIYLLIAYWVFLNNGASFLSKHPGLIVFRGFGTTKDITSETAIKMFVGLVLLSGTIAMSAMWILNIKVPTLN